MGSRLAERQKMGRYGTGKGKHLGRPDLQGMSKESRLINRRALQELWGGLMFKRLNPKSRLCTYKDRKPEWTDPEVCSWHMHRKDGYCYDCVKERPLRKGDRW